VNIENAAAVVTGGASGLGAATARALAKRGAKVSICDLNVKEGNLLAQEIGGQFHQLDVTSEPMVEVALESAERANGVARILVNCAGIAPAIKVVGKNHTPHSLASFRKVIETNLIGSFLVLSHFAARLTKQPPIGEERGLIINTASVAAYEGQIGHAAYAASKSGIIGLTLPVARELAESLIRIVAIAPGIFSTPMVAGLPPATRDSVMSQVPHPRRWGRPEEFAKLVEAIVENPMLNGETVRLDGGLRMAAR
jgi:NAD(P)-dependent dehydrogenase (short-subunit alcohol dehydrogenase family)